MQHRHWHIVSIGLLAMLSLTFILQAQEKMASKPTPSQGQAAKKTPRHFILGEWGGEHISLVATRVDAMLEFDCAHGWTDGPVRASREGRFDAPGWYVQEYPGPIRKDHPPEAHPAVYAGQVKGNEMTLTVKETDTNKVVGSFTLTRGKPPHIVKCV